MTSVSWAESYLGQLRALAGDRTLMFVGARGVVRDGDGRILLIQRSDNGCWAMPAGAMELGESITDCAVREIYEETGLRPAEVTPFAMHTGPDYTVTNQWGDTYQLFVVSFVVDAFDGQLARETDETIDAGFFTLDALPDPLWHSVDETMADLAAYEQTGRIVLK